MIMDSNIIVLNEDQLEDVIYKTVNRCLDERSVNSLVNNQPEGDGFYNRDELCNLLHIAYPTLGELKRQEYYKARKWDERISIPNRR